MEDPNRIANDYAAAIDRCRTVKEASVYYCDALVTYGPDGVNWRTVNGAILGRWSANTLEKIKREAWKAAKRGPSLSIQPPTTRTP